MMTDRFGKKIFFLITALLLSQAVFREASKAADLVSRRVTSDNELYYLPVTMHNKTGILYEKVFSVPVEEEGIQYAELDTTPYGPSALAVLPDGSFVIGDLVGNRLLRYSPTGEPIQAIDLDALGVTNVSDVVTWAVIFSCWRSI